MPIRFLCTEKIKLPPSKHLKLWLEKIAASEKRVLKNLDYNFCNDNELLRMNTRFLQHDTYTDILTFDYSENDTLSGEIYISVQRMEENAKRFKITFREELLRVMAHGLLHLCGYKDKSPLQQKQIRSAENRAIKLFKH